MSLPHYVLQTEIDRTEERATNWKFSLQSADGDDQFTAADTEPNTSRNRLELLVVVRGLEALDRPSRVTLFTNSKYVSRGIRRQLSHWREHKWQWERSGTMKPIVDADLWKRVDRAMDFHVVECRMPKSEDASARTESKAGASWSLATACGRLGRGILAPISAIRRPTFTQAA